MRNTVLGLGLAGGLMSVGPGIAQSGLSADQVEAAELELSLLGHDIEVDGVWDDASADALRDYERSWGLEETGLLDKDRHGRLVQEHPDTRSQYQMTKDGCEVWNEFPRPQEWVEWDGACTDGRATGQGTLTWHLRLDGEWRIGRYEGTMQNGRRNGEGLYSWHEGSSYRGGWLNGLRHGQGLYIWSNGDRYEGGWKDGMAHGEGVASYANGDVYRGVLAENTFNGAGVMSYGDGDKFDGMWRDGTPHGEGTYTAGEKVYSGNWTDGCFADGDRKTWVETSAEACGF